MVRQSQHRPGREGAQGREMAGLKRELAQARRTIARQEKRLRQLTAQLGETVEAEPSERPEPPPTSKVTKCEACGSTNVGHVPSFNKTVLRCCRDCKHRSKVVSV